jgi:hypothetical protein
VVDLPWWQAAVTPQERDPDVTTHGQQHRWPDRHSAWAPACIAGPVDIGAPEARAGEGSTAQIFGHWI